MILTHPALKMKDFYITLLSDSFMNMFPSNIQSEFTVKLDHPIEIDEETWEVALAEIATPSEVLNKTEDNNFFFLAFLISTVCTRTSVWKTSPRCVAMRKVTVINLSKKFQLEITCRQNI